MTEIRSWTSYAPAIREPLLPTAPPLGVIQEVYYFQGGNNGPVQVSHYLPGIYGFYVAGYSLGRYKYTPSAPPSTGTLVRPPSPYGEKFPSDAIMSVRIKEVIPSAPPLELMDIVSGYETASYDAVTAPPPPTLFESLSGPAPIREAYASAPGISEDEAKDALLQYISEKCCYGKAAARDLTITKVNYSSAFHYKLETFTEKRQTSWAYEPYKGETLDTLSNGTAPMPWEITVPSPEPFQNNVIQQGVPHTESMKSCHACHGTGQVPDGPCLGSGDIPCIHCHGDGTRTGSTGQREHCFFCQGTGKERCNSCGGSGKLTCKFCAGKGQLKCYIKLTISWTNNVADHIVERTNLPSGLIKKVSGQIAFEEELPRVWPINHFPDNTINMASAQLVQQHAVSFGNERVIMQRQQVRIIPVTEIHYQWKSHRGKFSVYGFENKVYAPEYPQTCCWGMCSIL